MDGHGGVDGGVNGKGGNCNEEKDTDMALDR